MNAVERAAEVIAAFFGENDSPTDAAQALADAGLLVTDADRAVLDAAKEVRRVWVETEDSPGLAINHLCDAFDAREAQS